MTSYDQLVMGQIDPQIATIRENCLELINHLMYDVCGMGNGIKRRKAIIIVVTDTRKGMIMLAYIKLDYGK